MEMRIFRQVFHYGCYPKCPFIAPYLQGLTNGVSLIKITPSCTSGKDQGVGFCKCLIKLTFEQLQAEDIKPQVTWGTSPEMVLPISAIVPNPADESDSVKSNGIKAALEYMGLTAGESIDAIKVDKVFIFGNEISFAINLKHDAVLTVITDRNNYCAFCSNT